MRKSEPACVLVTRFSALGDVALALPVLYDACRANPNVHFVLLSRPWAAALAQCPPDNLTIEAADLRGTHRGVAGMVRLATEMRRRHGVDAMADLHSVLRTWAIGAALRLRGVAVQRIDKGHADKRARIAGRIAGPLKPTTERYRDVFTRLGLDALRRFTSLYAGVPLPPCRIAGDKPAGQRWVAVAPFSAHEGKVYPLAQMHEVVQTLSARPDTRVFLMGGGQREADRLAPWAAESDNVTSVAAVEHTFADELALLARCDVMVSMDSANMHLASLVALPVVSVWGATHPDIGFLGYGQSTDLAVQSTTPCRPCSVFGERPCRHGDYRCLTAIAPADIVSKVDKACHSGK